MWISLRRCDMHWRQIERIPQSTVWDGVIKGSECFGCHATWSCISRLPLRYNERFIEIIRILDSLFDLGILMEEAFRLIDNERNSGNKRRENIRSKWEQSHEKKKMKDQRGKMPLKELGEGYSSQRYYHILLTMSYSESTYQNTPVQPLKPLF